MRAEAGRCLRYFMTKKKTGIRPKKLKSLLKDLKLCSSVAAAGRQSTDSFMFHNREQRGLFIIIIIIIIVVVVIISIIVITTFVPEPMLKRLQAPIGAEVLQVPTEPPWIVLYLFHDVFLSLCGSCQVILGNNKKHTDIIKGGGVVFIKDGFSYIPVTYRAAFRV